MTQTRRVTGRAPDLGLTIRNSLTLWGRRMNMNTPHLSRTHFGSQIKDFSMRQKKLYYLTVGLLLFLGVALIRTTGPRPIVSAATDAGNQIITPARPLSSPRSFFYERTFGETEVAYFADTAHIYNPEGVGVDGDGNLWVAETLGARVLKYSGDGTFLMSIGTAGRVWLADNKHISKPLDVAVDSDDNIWAVDQNSHRVVKYNAQGDYLMQLGLTWEAGSDNAHFNQPFSVAFDSAGRIYVSDAGNHRIQVFNSAGTYNTTIGVTGVPGSDNAHFNGPWRITIDSNDNLYVADLGNERVQIFNGSHGYLATLGVTGQLGFDNSHFNNPRGVAVDASRIYVADGGNHRVQIFDRTTRSYLTTLSTGGGSGNYQFVWPGDVAVDSSGNIYVADELNSRVQKFGSSLAFVRTFGTTGVPYLTDNYHYNMPSGVAVDADGNIGIVEDDFRGHRFIKLDASGVPQFTIGVAGTKGSDEAHFANPRDVAYDASGNIYVVDEWNHRIQIFSGDGTYQNTLGTGWGAGAYQFKGPWGVAVDGIGNIYVADFDNHRIQIFDSNRTYVATLGVTGAAGTDNSHFYRPTDVAVDADGNIYVADSWNNRVQKFNSSHVWQMTIGNLWGLTGVGVDLLGNIYVADTWNNRVLIYAGSGAYLTTIGGSWGNQVDQFRHPTGVDVDAAGNVYIADKDNHRIQKYAPGELVFLPLAVGASP
jgi:tripartite motif-containing protein 71